MRPMPKNGVRSRNLFDPKSDKPYKLSRSKLELFLKCPRCFYLDRRVGIGQPQGPAFTLNTAVDGLLKKEFDRHRAAREPHPLMREHGINAVPFQHPDLDVWRDNFHGVQYLHPPTNLLVTGAVDDVWVDGDDTLFVVDYKSTSTEKEISLDDQWKQAYKRQMTIYQWLLRGNEFTVSNTGYFVYVNAKKDRDGFDGRLEFSAQVIPHEDTDAWVHGAVVNAHRCLVDASPPPSATECEWCAYRQATRDAGNL